MFRNLRDRTGPYWHACAATIVARLWRNAGIAAALMAAGTSLVCADPPTLPEPEPELHAPQPALPKPAPCADAEGVLQGPILSTNPSPAKLGTAQPDELDRPLPINLATALRLADARPLVIAAAQASVQIAAGELERASVLWVPSFNLGSAYIRHDGGNQNAATGGLVMPSTNFFLGGAGLTVEFATTDAIFAPLAARQVMQARQSTIQTARNDALLSVAEAYFTVQQARGTYAGMLDAVAKCKALVRRVEGLSKGLAAPIEIDRARTLLADLEQAAASAQEEWRVASANLTRILRLDPAAVMMPMEPDHMQVTLISPQQPVDILIPIGLTARPELATQQALVQATLTRLRQEKLRPLIPSVLLTGNGTPEFFFNGGIFGTGSGSSLNQWAGRSDVSVQVVWQLENLGLGNQGRVRERQGQRQLALVELFRVQDTIAAEVAQAQARLLSAAIRVGKAETGLKEGMTSYEGNLRGLGETTRFGDVFTLIVRPQEVVAALQQLQQAYTNYFRTIADYNRSQFRLYHALGYPSEILACHRPPGEPLPIDTTRNPHLPPVCAPQPCNTPR